MSEPRQLIATGASYGKGRFAHALSLARYNRPLYALSGATAVVGLSICLLPSVNFALRLIGALAAAVATWYAVASFAAFHAMFDRSPLLSGTWLRKCVAAPPGACVQLSVGLEQTTLPLGRVFPDAECVDLDLFDPAVMTEPAVSRAKGRQEGAAAAPETPPALTPASPDALPIGAAASDLTVVTLAAHELRSAASREALFGELSRVMKPGGTVVVVEHLRNVAALLAFGPGLMHFYPRGEWLRLARVSGLGVTAEFDITPFVHVFVLRRAAGDQAARR